VISVNAQERQSKALANFILLAITVTLLVVLMRRAVELDRKNRIVFFVANNEIEMGFQCETLESVTDAAAFNRNHVSQTHFDVNVVAILLGKALQLPISNFLVAVHNFLEGIHAVVRCHAFCGVDSLRPEALVRASN
jgi:hypothetical protein